MATDPSPDPETVEAWREGYRLLAADPAFGPWVQRIGPVRLPESTEGPFYYLARTICYQQLAGAAARTIHGRFVDALNREVTPEAVLGTPEKVLRAAGLSGSKLRAIRDLADKILGGEVVVDDLEEQPDDEVVRRLTRVWGIGEWTAQMYLMFRLRRPDVWPVGDLGVRSGYAKAHAMDPAPAAAALDPLGEPYRPWRSAVAFYCWRILDTELA